MLLKTAPVEHTPERRLRELLLLALRVAALRAARAGVCAAVLSRRPVQARRRHDGRRARHVAQHVGAGPVRARAGSWRRTRSSSAPAGDDVAVVTFADRLRWSSAPSADRALAAAAIDAAARLRIDAVPRGA